MQGLFGRCTCAGKGRVGFFVHAVLVGGCMPIIKAGSGLPFVPNWALMTRNESLADACRRLADQPAVCSFKIQKTSCSSQGPSLSWTPSKSAARYACTVVSQHFFSRNRCFVQTVEHSITMFHLLALAAVAWLLSSAQADDSSLPSDWRTGIATNYGGSQDGKARPSNQSMLQSSYCM